mmetsp:Transcript_78954/g.142430  ORF Transcript_78954/g.142430 Transcript_78954/m.142430 type:complete len:299 (+) Transcript_78954:72-968(+)
MAGLLDTSEYTSRPFVSMPVEYNARDLIIYALGIGSSDPRYVYENHPEFAAFPTYPIVLTFKGEGCSTLPFPSPIMLAYGMPPLENITVGLDAEKLIEKVAELPKDGAKLRLVGRLAGVHQKGKGALVERLFELVDDTGKIYYRMIDAGFLVGATGFKDSGETYSKAVKPPAAAPAHIVETKTDKDVANLYRLSGDYNPLHIDPDFAKLSGFEQPILHGNCTLGHATRALLDAVAGGDQKRFKSVQLRYAGLVIPGQTLVTEIWQVSPTEYIFQVKVKETGKFCVSNGHFLLTPQGRL